MKSNITCMQHCGVEYELELFYHDNFDVNGALEWFKTTNFAHYFIWCWLTNWKPATIHFIDGCTEDLADAIITTAPDINDFGYELVEVPWMRWMGPTKTNNTIMALHPRKMLKCPLYQYLYWSWKTAYMWRRGTPVNRSVEALLMCLHFHASPKTPIPYLPVEVVHEVLSWVTWIEC